MSEADMPFIFIADDRCYELWEAWLSLSYEGDYYYCPTVLDAPFRVMKPYFPAEAEYGD